MSKAGDFLRDHAKHRRFISRRAHATAEAMPPRSTYRFLVLLAFLSLLLANIRFLRVESVEDVIPTWAIWLWSVLLILGGTFTLIAPTWEARVTGMLVERAGHTAISTVCLSYGASTVLAIGYPYPSSYLLLLAGLASAFRAIKVHKELVSVRKFMREVLEFKGATA